MRSTSVLTALMTLLVAAHAHAGLDCAKRAKEIFKQVERLEKIDLDEKTFEETAGGESSETKAKHFTYEMDLKGPLAKKYNYFTVLEANEEAKKCLLVTLERQALPAAGL